MRQAARIASLVVVILLAFVGTASAECAWLLWRVEESTLSSSPIKWDAPVAYPDRAACVTVIDRHVKKWEDSRASNQR